MAYLLCKYCETFEIYRVSWLEFGTLYRFDQISFPIGLAIAFCCSDCVNKSMDGMSGNQETISNDASIDQTTAHTSKAHFLTPKGFVPIIVLVLVVLTIALGGFYLVRSQKPTLKPQNTKIVQQSLQSPSPTPLPSDETANWKTYTNGKYQFSFKYPSELRLVEYEHYPYGVTLWTSSKWATWLRIDPVAFGRMNVFSTLPLPAFNNANTIDVTFAGRKAKEYPTKQQQTNDNIPGYPTYAYVRYIGILDPQGLPWQNSNEISYEVFEGDDRYKEIFDKILSTFKFTNQSQAAFEAPPLYPKYSWGKSRTAEFAPNDRDTNATTVTGEEITSTGPSQKLSPDNDIFVYYQDYFAKYPEWKPYLSANMASIDGLYASEAGWKQGNHYFIVRVGNLHPPTMATIWRN